MMKVFSLDFLLNSIGDLLLESCEEFIGEEIIPVTPMSPPENPDRGELRRSIEVVKINNKKCVIYVNELIAPYGVYVHYMPNTVNWSTPNTGNRFLERPIRTKGNKIYEKLDKKIKSGGIKNKIKYKVWKLGSSNVGFKP